MEPPDAADTTPNAPALFAPVASAMSRIEATAARLEKAAEVARALGPLGDDDLARAVRLLSGSVFPAYDQRAVGVGGAMLARAVERVSGVDTDALRARTVALGDAGDAAAEALAGRVPTGAPLTLAALDEAFAALAATAGTARRTDALAALLARTTSEEARYLVRLLAGDARIGLREGGMEDALARTFSRPLHAVQRAAMLTGDIGETAVLARQDRLAEAALRLFHPFRFMLATAADDADDAARTFPGGFLVEDKYDGIRAQLHVGAASPATARAHGAEAGAAHIALFSRQLSDITRAFPDLVAALAPFAGAAGAGAVLDGEIVPVSAGDASQVVPFQVLQGRLGRKKVSAETLAERPVAFVPYDLLVDDGAVVLEEPLTARRARLDALAPRLGLLPAPQQTATAEALDALYDAARARGNEGLMLKRADAPYRPGKRGRDWLKVKRALATLDVVVTSAERGYGKRRAFLSDLAFAVRTSATDGTLLNVGKAYSGLTDAELAEVTALLESHTLQTHGHGKVHVVEPVLVLEVAFERVQPSKRHKSGYALRFPRIVRLRPDKPLAEIDTLASVSALADDGSDADA